MKDDFSSRTALSIVTSIAPALLDQSNETSWIFPVLKSTKHFLPKSTVSGRLDSNSEANSTSPSSSRFSTRRVWDFGDVNWYSWFEKSLNRPDWGGELSFFHGIHVRTDIKIDISLRLWLPRLASRHI